MDQDDLGAYTGAVSQEERDRRICETAIAVLDGAEHKRLNIVVLNKAMFYADLFALRDLGETISGSRYLALPKGPTVEGYQRRLVKKIAALGWAEQISAGMAKPVQKIATPDEWRFITNEGADLARKLGTKFSRISSMDASNYSHQNVGWLRAKSASDDLNGRGTPINMVLAMQQIADEDEWLTSPWTDDELRSIDVTSGAVLYE